MQGNRYPSRPRQACFGSLSHYRLATLYAGNDGPHFTPVPDYAHEDWRSADRSLELSSAFLVYSTLVETRHIDWLQRPERWGYLMAPLLAYHPSLSQRDAFALPYDAG